MKKIILLVFIGAASIITTNANAQDVNLPNASSNLSNDIKGFGVNNPPVLDENYIYDRWLQTGATLNFVAFANDLDNDVLTFYLDANSLSKGMLIDSNTGSFGWMTDVNGSHDGVHTVTITVSDGIDTDSKSFEVKVGAAANLSELTKSQINIYPNPAQDVLSISSDANVQDITIISAVGELVYTGTKTNNIDVSYLKSGVYIITCLLENKQVVTKRFIKN